MDKKQVTDQPDNDVIEVRLTDIWLFFKRSRWSILGSVVIFGILGGIYAAVLPNEYTSQVTVMPEVQPKLNGSLSGLGSLAGLAGINLDNLAGTQETIRPDLYPTVVQSIPFAAFLLNQKVTSVEFGNIQLLKDYIQKHKQSSFYGILLTKLGVNYVGDDKLNVENSSGIVKLTRKQEDLVLDLLKNIVLSSDKKTGVITISASMPDPLVAASTAQNTLTYLTNYITTYRTEKARKEVLFLTNQVSFAKKRYQLAEYNLSAYRDRNRDLYTNTAKIEEQRIQAEYLLAQDLYNSLTKQLELSKIKVQEQTPVFSVLNPAQVPLQKSKPKRFLIILSSISIGIILGIVKKIIQDKSLAL